MLSLDEARAIALEFPEAAVAQHFERSSFRVRTKIFATMGGAGEPAVIKLQPGQQAMMTEVRGELYQPVPGRWGMQGWTQVSLDAADADAFRHALTLSYRNVAPKKLAALVS